MTYNAKESVDGFPGDMLVTARFTLDNDNVLQSLIQVKWRSSDPLNPTNHVYFNLGEAKTWHTIPLLWLLTVT